jgi:hypothetical protein
MFMNRLPNTPDVTLLAAHRRAALVRLAVGVCVLAGLLVIAAMTPGASDHEFPAIGNAVVVPPPSQTPTFKSPDPILKVGSVAERPDDSTTASYHSPNGPRRIKEKNHVY